MCSLAPRAAAPGSGATATAFLNRQRGVVAAMAPAATSGHNDREPSRRPRASEVSAAPARKRGRHDAFEHVVVDPAPAASSALRIRMDKELVALQGLLKRAKLLPCPRSAAPAEKKCAPAPAPAPRRSEAPAASSPSASKKTAPPLKPATEATYVAAKQQRPVEHAAAKNSVTKVEVPSERRPAEAPAAAGKKQQPVQHAAAAKTEAPNKKQRPEEEEAEKKKLALAAEREKFRQMLVDMEKSAQRQPDYTVRQMLVDLEEFGIPFEFVTTRTWKQACEDHANAKKMKLLGAPTDAYAIA